MHGRLKVKTSEQQAAEKKAARAEKMKLYQGAMAALLSHRLEHSEGQLKMTSGLLQANPDITTLWNIRKEALVLLMSQLYVDFHPLRLHDQVFYWLPIVSFKGPFGVTNLLSASCGALNGSFFINYKLAPC